MQVFPLQMFTAIKEVRWQLSFLFTGHLTRHRMTSLVEKLANGVEAEAWLSRPGDLPQ
jgi:hypothetical protein